MDIKDLLKSRRIQLRLSQEDVAKHVGVSDATVSRWESGEIENMGRSRIIKLAQVLQLSPAAIMGWENKDDGSAVQAQSNGEAWALRERLRRQPSARMLLDATEDATAEEIQQYVNVIKALRMSHNDE